MLQAVLRIGKIKCCAHAIPNHFSYAQVCRLTELIVVSAGLHEASRLWIIRCLGSGSSNRLDLQTVKITRRCITRWNVTSSPNVLLEVLMLRLELVNCAYSSASD